MMGLRFCFFFSLSLLFCFGFSEDSDPNYSETVDPFNIDEHQLEQAIEYCWNKKRASRNKQELIEKEKFNEVVQYYDSLFQKKNWSNILYLKTKITKTYFEVSHAKDFSAGWLNLSSVVVNAMNYKGDYYFYNKEDQETTHHLFKGRSKDLKDSTKVLQPVASYTYYTLAKSICRDLIRNSGEGLKAEVKYFGCRVRALRSNKRKIPKLKVLFFVASDIVEEIREK